MFKSVTRQSSEAIEGWKFAFNEEGKKIGVTLGTHFDVVDTEGKTVCFFAMSKEDQEAWIQLNLD